MGNGKSILGTVMIDPRVGGASDQKGRDCKQTVNQVWFGGVHTDVDVGGGYKQRRVSDIPLCWMIDRAIDNNILAYPLKLAPYNLVNPK